MDVKQFSHGVLGKKIVLVPTTGAPATTKAQLDVPKANVRFTVADVGATAGTARIKLFVASKVPFTKMAAAETF